MEYYKKEYKVVQHPEKDKFTELVNDDIKDGWNPQGGVCFTKTGVDGFPFYLSQAMVRKIIINK